MAAIVENPLIAPVLPAELSYASPGIRTRPPTLFLGRIRRSNGSSSDETPRPEPDGFEESDLRAGGPQLPESPCETTVTLPHTYKDHDLFKGYGSYVLNTQLADICRRENVHHDSLSFCGRRSVYEAAADPIFTLLVVARRDQSTGSWINLARKLSDHLCGQGLQGLNVEITDPKFFERPSIHPCLATDAIFPVWTQVATDIAHGIDRTGVFTISCFRIGCDDDRLKCPPTVLLGVDKNVKRDWKVVREEIVSILDRHRLNGVAVTIRKDNEIIRDGYPDDKDMGSRPNDCLPGPRPATSISPRTIHDSNGTLGGWVEVRGPTSGKWFPLALTCSHCCFPREQGLSEGDLKVIREWKHRGVGQSDARRDRLLLMDSPSYRDMTTGIKAITAEIEEKKSIEDYRHVEALKQQNEFILPYMESFWKDTSEAIAALESEEHQMRDLLNSNAHHLGNVFAASGKREVQSTEIPSQLSTRDWALVQPILPRCAGKNAVILPSVGKAMNIKKLWAVEIGTPDLEQKLLIIGRETGYKTGKYGGLKACHLATKTINGQKVDFETWEHTVVVPKTKSIAAEGDSGSFVFDLAGNVLGMIFGGTGLEDEGYFTATRDLLADIELITGLKDVRLCGQE